MRIAIVDDSPGDRDILDKKLASYMTSHNISYETRQYTCAEDFLNEFRVSFFDLVFMDIYMKDITGMDAAKQIYRLDPGCRIIFLTNTEEYSRMSYSVRAVYYLLKPISDEEFLQAMSFLELKTQYTVPTLDLTVQHVPVSIPTEDIYYIEYHARSTVIHTRTDTIEVRLSFQEVIAKLLPDERFLSPIRAVLINMQHIRDVDDLFFILDNQTRIRINVRHRNAIIRQWKNYLYRFKKGE